MDGDVTARLGKAAFVAEASMTMIWRTTLEVLDADGIPATQRAFLHLARLVGLLDGFAMNGTPKATRSASP